MYAHVCVSKAMAVQTMHTCEADIVHGNLNALEGLVYCITKLDSIQKGIKVPPT